jgi:hypothetical protein
MSPLPTVSGSSSVDLPGDGVEARKAARLDVSNDRQHVGRKLRRLCLAGHAHPLDGAGGIGRTKFLSARLGGRQGRLGALRDRLTLVFGATTLLSFLLLKLCRSHGNRQLLCQRFGDVDRQDELHRDGFWA